MHSYADLAHVSPIIFLFLLKEFYVRGRVNPTAKFRYLQQVLRQALHNAPRPGPATFVARCLFLLPVFDILCYEFSHLIICSLRRVLEIKTSTEDLLKAKSLAAQIFLCSAEGQGHVENVLAKIVEVFDVKLEDLKTAKHVDDLDAAEALVKQYICNLVESESYKTAGKLLKHFSLRDFGEWYMSKLLEGQRHKAAEKLAVSMGNPTLSVLAQHYIDHQMSKEAYEIIKSYHLKGRFPEVYEEGKKRSLKCFAEKGLWDLAEERIKNDKQLLEYLANLAVDARYFEKVEELRDRYSLEGFDNVEELEASPRDARFLYLDEEELEGIKWVDDARDLHDAIGHIEGCEVVGLDSESKPIYKKGMKQKVCILQISAEKMVYILDLIKLFEDVPDVLDNCLSRLFHSRILKLGYDFENDMMQLAISYEGLKCFQHCERLLDFRNSSHKRGGLSGLAKKILGAEIDKTRRVSNWEQRPLTQKQLEYAALDAAVLLKIYAHLPDQAEFKVRDWTSGIGHHLDKPPEPMNGSASGWIIAPSGWES
ncbi:hypothetical protein DCAR_0729021 [Daucus carota subsp. sativus]|uniref:3'-5' exonuclease domain-containing protein n=1 Tax=Daucus carota subsp. sativus TaxID=79200 RepID=A0AAF0XMM2_DAUCS|nr:hypothetical protein DCAR_0729021 [Daucus carota subsp. sativus]